jgi:hypothetical protein
MLRKTLGEAASERGLVYDGVFDWSKAKVVENNKMKNSGA